MYGNEECTYLTVVYILHEEGTCVCNVMSRYVQYMKYKGTVCRRISWIQYPLQKNVQKYPCTPSYITYTHIRFDGLSSTYIHIYCILSIIVDCHLTTNDQHNSTPTLCQIPWMTTWHCLFQWKLPSAWPPGIIQSFPTAELLVALAQFLRLPMARTCLSCWY